MPKIVNGEDVLESTARFFLNVFSEQYDEKFEKMLVSGGGGNSMFVNAWQKPSKHFINARLSGEAKTCLAVNRYTLETMPHGFLCNNAKGSANRKAKGKHLHMDHNPGNVKVLHDIRDKVRSYSDEMSHGDKIADLKEFMKKVQTLDIITVEQDDIRTLSDEHFTKKEKDMMSAKGRDTLLNDTWEDLGPRFKYKF